MRLTPHDQNRRLPASTSHSYLFPSRITRENTRASSSPVVGTDAARASAFPQALRGPTSDPSTAPGECILFPAQVSGACDDVSGDRRVGSRNAEIRTNFQRIVSVPTLLEDLPLAMVASRCERPQESRQGGDEHRVPKVRLAEGDHEGQQELPGRASRCAGSGCALPSSESGSLPVRRPPTRPWFTPPSRRRLAGAKVLG